MPRLPKGQEPLSMLVGLRLPLSEFRALWEEAEKSGLDMVSYLRMLIRTHPRRKKERERKK
jgi:hypothetical protein